MFKEDTRLRLLFGLLAAMAILACVLGGTLYYVTLYKTSLKMAHKDAEERLSGIVSEVNSYMKWSVNSVRILAEIKELTRAAAGEQDVSDAEDLLIHYQYVLKADVCYLMDRSGTVIAASNSGTPDSFLGRNYKFRPYFSRAIQGEPCIYMALGTTSKKRGVYFSHPVGFGEKPDGVAVIKVDMAAVEEKNYGSEIRHGVNAVLLEMLSSLPIRNNGFFICCGRNHRQ